MLSLSALQAAGDGLGRWNVNRKSVLANHIISVKHDDEVPHAAAFLMDAAAFS